MAGPDMGLAGYLASEQVTCLNSLGVSGNWESKMFIAAGFGNLISRKGVWIAGLAAWAALLPAVSRSAAAEGLSPQQQLAFDIYKELVEINTVTATGDTARAAEAMAARLRTA